MAEAAEILEEARRRFALDPEFHARVHRAVQIVQLDHEQLKGSDSRMTNHERGAATTAAAIAVVLAERPIDWAQVSSD